LACHVKTEPSDKEPGIYTELHKLLSMTNQFKEMTPQQKSCVSDLLRQLQAVFIGASITESILLFMHLETFEVLQSVHRMYESGQLKEIVRDLFCCLAKDDNLSVEVEIGAELFKQCEDGLNDDGKFVPVFLRVVHKCAIWLLIRSYRFYDDRFTNCY